MTQQTSVQGDEQAVDHTDAPTVRQASPGGGPGNAGQRGGTSGQTIRQQARLATRAMADRRRQKRVETERRLAGLAEQVLVALGQRDRAVLAAETRAGAVIRRWTDGEGLSVAEIVDWCGGKLTVREANRLRRLCDAADGHPAAGSSIGPSAGSSTGSKSHGAAGGGGGGGSASG